MLFTESEYKSMREDYSYCDRDCRFKIVVTAGLDGKFTGQYAGIFPKKVPPHYGHGINLRRFETVVQAVFADASHAEAHGTVTSAHILNLKEMVCAVVHWKMASQGGRAGLKVNNVREKWGEDTAEKLINAYRRKEIALFEIGGIRIPTATAFLRFLFPYDYGIMDSRVARITQEKNITQLDLRGDGYIKDTHHNREQYTKSYNLFLVNEARQLNRCGILFQDIDENGSFVNSTYRPCDIEMALF
ncbi:MAG: hypothetical protein NT022_13370 [Deltaproteobacteria bacterium]|nr:hypothetical protein [Deltaproteobacteria bacterium]